MCFGTHLPWGGSNTDKGDLAVPGAAPQGARGVLPQAPSDHQLCNQSDFRVSSVQLLRAKFGQGRITPGMSEPPQTPQPCSPWALAPTDLFPAILIWTKP